MRKTANPFQPLLLRWEAVAIFALLVVVQQGLIWGIWHGHFPEIQPWAGRPKFYESEPLLSIVHGGTMLVGDADSGRRPVRLPERVRVEAFGLGSEICDCDFFPQCGLARCCPERPLPPSCWPRNSFCRSKPMARPGTGRWQPASFFLMFSLLLEFCRLRFRRRALGFVALWLFVLCILPFILAGVFSNEALAKLSLLAPGDDCARRIGTD